MALRKIPFEEEFQIYSGGTFTLTLHWYLKDGSPMLLSTWDAWLSFGVGTSAALGELSVAGGQIVMDDEGLIKITMGASYTAALADDPTIPIKNGTGTLRYNLTLLEPDVDPELGTKRFMRGQLFIIRDVPRVQ